MQKLFALILLFSLGLNIYFISQIKTPITPVLTNKFKDTEIPKSREKHKDLLSPSEDAASSFLENNSDQQKPYDAERETWKLKALQAYQSADQMNPQELFDIIQSLHANKQYDDLTLPLRAYLKRYPNDQRAWLIEADHILQTEPLNVAIAAYYDLLEKNLTDEDTQKVKKIIQVNTSTVIQQLSRDGAWNLLATFLEPLLQIDPLNHNFIIGLAKAYGKQEQFTLMENALAALDYSDARAQQLRKSIYQTESSDSLLDNRDEENETASLRRRKVPVSGNGQQFFVKTTVHRSSHLFLLDTGASTTAISQRVFRQIPMRDKEFVGRFKVQTAGGAVEAPLFKISSIMLGKVVINNVSIIVLPQDSFSDSFEGLLGMNVLRNFDFRFDPATQNMTLLER